MNEIELIETPVKVSNLVTHLNGVLVKMRLVIGLQGLLRLQFDHEGHMNCEVATLTIDTVAEIEQELSQVIIKLLGDSPPF